MIGVKIHLKYDINNSLPEYLFITNANEHENNTLKKMNLSKGCTVAFDKGYCNYAVFGDFCRDKIFFVTRLKENAVKTQIWIALIVYLLFMELRHLCTRPGKNFTDFISELKVCILNVRIYLNGSSEIRLLHFGSLMFSNRSLAYEIICQFSKNLM